MNQGISHIIKYKMSKIKKVLPETWYQHQEQINLHWMEEEYFGNLAKQNIKKNPYDKPNK